MVENISFELRNENGNLASFNVQSITFRLSIKEVRIALIPIKRRVKGFGFQRALRTADVQDKNQTTVANDVTVTIESIYLYVPNFIPEPETQVMFNDQKKFYIII